MIKRNILPVAIGAVSLFGGYCLSYLAMHIIQIAGTALRGL